MGALVKFMLAVAVGLMTAVATAETGVSSTAAGDSGTDTKTYGLFVGLGDPFPSLLGVNAAYNINHDLRASVGYGNVEVTSSVEFTANGVEEKKIKADTYAAGLEYLFLPTAVRGIIGAHVGYFNISGEGSFNLQGFSKSTAYMYSNMGLDWVAQSGFQLGAGMQLAYLGGSGSGFYVNSGWYY